MDSIFSTDWFKNRTEIGNYKFDKSNAIYNFYNNSAAKTLYGKRVKELVENPRKLERECEAMHSLIDNKKGAVVKIHKVDKSCFTDGKNIVISGLPIIDYLEDGLDIVFGTLVHESCHIRFSDFKQAKETSQHKALHWIWNLIEDEVIEEMIQIEKPGLGNFLSKVKDYMFAKNDEPEFSSDIEEIAYILFGLIRYPIILTNINKSILDKYEDLFNDIYNILNKHNILDIYVNNNATYDNINAAKEIYELIIKYLEEQQSGQKPCNSESQNEKSTIAQEFDNMFENGEPKDGPLGDITTLLGGSDEYENNKSNKGQYSKELLEASDIKENNSNYNSRGTNACKNLKYYKPAGKNTELYNSFKKEITPYIKLIKDIELKKNLVSMSLSKEEYQRKGSIDPRCLATAYQGVSNVYQRFNIKTQRNPIKKFNVVLALDESGSMIQIRNEVTKLAIAFVEAFKNDPQINLWVYGHSEYVIPYVTPNKPDYETLANRYQGGGQNEVEAYKTILAEVTKVSKEPVLFINITDSQYLANYSDIEKELARWNSKTYQSLIVVDSYLTESDKLVNDRIYGKDKWANIINIDNYNLTSIEIKKIVKHINSLNKRHK